MYYREGELRGLASGVTASGARETLRKQAGAPRGQFDVFLSHSITDSVLVLGVRKLLESQGLTVYVDWIDDPDLERQVVSSATAKRLRQRMQQSRALVYATSRAALKSRWMPWELGYFDGLRDSERISILPIENGSGISFDGQEYLGLYKMVERLPNATGPRVVTKTRQSAETLRSFVSGFDHFQSITTR